MKRKGIVVVTGVSTGIGWSTVKVLLAHGYQVFGTVRRQIDADRLCDNFMPRRMLDRAIAKQLGLARP